MKLLLKYFFMPRWDFLTDILNFKIEYVLSGETHNDPLKVPWSSLSIGHFFNIYLGFSLYYYFYFQVHHRVGSFKFSLQKLRFPEKDWFDPLEHTSMTICTLYLYAPLWYFFCLGAVIQVHVNQGFF